MTSGCGFWRFAENGAVTLLRVVGAVPCSFERGSAPTIPRMPRPALSGMKLRLPPRTSTTTCPSADVIPFALCWGRLQQTGGVVTSSWRASSSVVRLHPRRHDISRHFPLFFLSFLLLFPSFFLCVQHTNTNALAHGFVGTADLLVGGGFDSHRPPQKTCHQPPHLPLIAFSCCRPRGRWRRILSKFLR